MLNVRRSRSRQRPSPTKPWRGKLTILWVTLIFVTLSACATQTPLSPRFQVQIPPRPLFEYGPEVVGCAPTTPDVPKPIAAVEGRCIVIWEPDWLSIGTWALTLERELKAACLALGGSALRCGTEPSSP